VGSAASEAKGNPYVAGTSLSVTPEAFADLVGRYNDDLFRLAFAMTGDRALAEDAVQGCWLAAWRSRGELRDAARIRGWLLTITANQVRRQARRDRLRLLLQGRRPSRWRDEDPGEYVDLARALAKLSPQDRELVAMRYYLGLSSAQIAPMLRLSPSGTRRRLQRVLFALRKELHYE
jgi:RNA polymerase sigma factor (sigma-70 family)